MLHSIAKQYHWHADGLAVVCVFLGLRALATFNQLREFNVGKGFADFPTRTTVQTKSY